MLYEQEREPKSHEMRRDPPKARRCGVRPMSTVGRFATLATSDWRYSISVLAWRAHALVWSDHVFIIDLRIGSLWHWFDRRWGGRHCRSTDAVGGVILMAASCLIGILVLAAVASTIVCVVTESSDGNEQIQNWPQANPGEWFLPLIYFLMAGFVSALPRMADCSICRGERTAKRLCTLSAECSLVFRSCCSRNSNSTRRSRFYRANCCRV